MLEIVRTGSARATAQSLYLSESAVSKTLKELEEDLGLKLFVRSRRGMVATEAGLKFARYAGNSLDAINLGIEVLSDTSGTRSTTLRIGASPGIAEVLMAAVVKEMTDEVSGLCVEVVAGNQMQLLDQLRKGDIEFVLSRLPLAPNLVGLTFEQLTIDRLVFVVRPEHPLARKPRVDLREVSKCALTLPPSDTAAWQELQRCFIANGARLSPARLETHYLQVSRNFVLNSDAVWAVSAWVAQMDLAQGRLAKLAIESPMLDSPLGAITKPGSVYGLHAQAMLKKVRQHCLLAAHGSPAARPY